MTAPWEKYAAAQGGGAGPWEKYGGAARDPKAIPGNEDAYAPAQGNSGQPDKVESSIFDKARGAAGALATAASGATTGALGYAGATLGGIAGQVRMGELGSPEGSARAAQGAEDGFEKLTYGKKTPESDAILEGAGRLAEKTGVDKLQGLGPMAAPQTGRARAAVNAVKGDAERLGALARQEGELAKMAVKKSPLGAIPSKLADVVTPKPSPEIAALAKKAEDMGIELRPDMLANNRIAKFIGEALEQVPASGSKAEQRQMAFNAALGKIIGAEGKAERITPDVFDKAITASGEKIGQISKETPITVTPELRHTFNERVQQAAKFETQDVAKIVSNYVQELDGLAENGVIPGEAFRKINSKIGRQIRATSNGDLKNALYELQEDMHGALEANIASPERLAELKDARYKYAMAKTIEPLVADAKGGDISPARLMHAVTSDKAKKAMMARGKGGEMGDLARIGQAFLKEPPSSGTGERLGAYSLLSGHGLMLAPLIPAANVYNRAGPALTKRAIDMRKVDPQAQQPWNIGIP